MKNSWGRLMMHFQLGLAAACIVYSYLVSSDWNKDFVEGLFWDDGVKCCPSLYAISHCRKDFYFLIVILLSSKLLIISFYPFSYQTQRLMIIASIMHPYSWNLAACRPADARVSKIASGTAMRHAQTSGSMAKIACLGRGFCKMAVVKWCMWWWTWIDCDHGQKIDFGVGYCLDTQCVYLVTNTPI